MCLNILTLYIKQIVILSLSPIIIFCVRSRKHYKPAVINTHCGNVFSVVMMAWGGRRSVTATQFRIKPRYQSTNHIHLAYNPLQMYLNSDWIFAVFCSKCKKKTHCINSLRFAAIIYSLSIFRASKGKGQMYTVISSFRTSHGVFPHYLRLKAWRWFHVLIFHGNSQYAVQWGVDANEEASSGYKETNIYTIGELLEFCSQFKNTQNDCSILHSKTAINNRSLR